MPAQNAAVRATSSDVVAFSDANSMWEPDALRRLVRHFADPEVGYVCGRLRLIEPGTGRNVEGQYWRYELWLRALESRLGSITAGNGAIYAVRRSAYVELEPGQSHDIGLPFRLRRAGLRSLYEPEAVASELSAPTTSAEWERKVRMLSRSWADVLRGGMLDPRDQPPAVLRRADLAPPAALRDRPAARRPAAGGARAGDDDAERARRGRRPRAVARARPRRPPQPRSQPARRLRLVLPRRHRRVAGRARPDGHAGAAGHVVRGGGDAMIKRGFDVLVAVAALVVTAPLMLVIALLIRLEDRGPALLRQSRVGLHGEDFDLFKFRTMVPDAHALGTGWLIAEHDPRITRVGRVLRKWSLDELPQVFNVLRGEMSIVGPRPTLRYQVDQYTPFQRRRLAVRPGITGWAQIRGRNTLGWPQRIELDVWYVEHCSLRLDLQILAAHRPDAGQPRARLQRGARRLGRGRRPGRPRRGHAGRAGGDPGLI